MPAKKLKMTKMGLAFTRYYEGKRQRMKAVDAVHVGSILEASGDFNHEFSGEFV